MKSLGSIRWISLAGLALTFSLVGCNGGAKEDASKDQKPQTASIEKTSQTPAKPASPEEVVVDTPEEKAALVKELAEARKHAAAKAAANQEQVDPEVAKRMQDPKYRETKQEMLNQFSQLNTRYFKQGIEIRHTRKRPEWRLIDPKLAEVKDPAQRRKQGEELATRFKKEVEPILDKSVAVKVFADAAETIEVY